MDTNKKRILKYLNNLKKKPIKKDIDYLIRIFKIKVPKNKTTVKQKYIYIKNKYKIKKVELFHEVTVKELKNILKKKNINIIGKKKKMFLALTQSYNPKNQIYFASFSNIGKRDYQEDRLSIYNNSQHYISCVYDGHGGNKCSIFLKNNFYKAFMKSLQTQKPIPALFNTFLKLNKSFLSQIIGRDGSTANILFFNKKNNTCYLANTGDSRSILCRKNGVVEQISEDHKPDTPSERSRIQSKGGFVQYGRTNGNLAMSRSFGDKNLIDVITVEPDIYQFSNRNIKYILQASDGLFDVMSNREVCNFINTRLRQKVLLNDIAKQLVLHAINNRKSQDNTSVIITFF